MVISAARGDVIPTKYCGITRGELHKNGEDKFSESHISEKSTKSGHIRVLLLMLLDIIDIIHIFIRRIVPNFQFHPVFPQNYAKSLDNGCFAIEPSFT